MTAASDVTAAIATLSADLTAKQDELSVGIKALIDDITALQASSNGAATSADLDGFISSLQGLDATVKAIPVPAVP